MSGLGTLQEDILPQAINLITCETPHSTPSSATLYTVVQRVRPGMIMAWWSVVEDVLGCPAAVMSRHGCHTYPPENHRNKPDRRLANSFRCCSKFADFHATDYRQPPLGWLCTTSFPAQFLHLTIWQQNMFWARIRAALSHPWAWASMGGLGVKLGHRRLIPTTHTYN